MKKNGGECLRRSAVWYNGLVKGKLSILAALALALFFALPCEAARRSDVVSVFDGPYTLPILGFAAGIFVIIGIGAVFAKKANEKQAAEDAEVEFQKWEAMVEANGGELPVYEADELDLRLAEDETCYFVADGVTLCEPRAVRAGGYAGGSVRTPSSVSIHSGRFEAESHDEWREVTRGTLYVTDQRIVFDGEIKNRTVKLEDLMSFKPAGKCRLVVNSERLQKPLAFATVNAQILATVLFTLRESTVS